MASFKSLVPGSQSSRATAVGNTNYGAEMLRKFREIDATLAGPAAAAAPPSTRLGYTMRPSRAEEAEQDRATYAAAMSGQRAQDAAASSSKIAEINRRLERLRASAAKHGVSAKERKRTAVTELPSSPKTAAQTAKAAALSRDAAIAKKADELRDEWYDNNEETAVPPTYSYFVRMAEEELSGEGRYRPEMKGRGREIPLVGSTRPY